MSRESPRLRMFAGPNGSGKSVLKGYLPEPLLGVYLNPDEIESAVKKHGHLNFHDFGVETTAEQVLPFFTGSEFLIRQGFLEQTERLTFADNRLGFPPGVMNSYYASVATDILRHHLLKQRASFTFETVMSHPGKVALLARAQQAGYRTYLYYVATDDPAINVSRVANRVALGGHAVPEEKIVERYHKSLGLLREAIRYSHRAYIFDNSTDSADQEHTWLAEITDGTKLELKADRMPAWFKKAVLDQVNHTPA